MTTFRSYGEVSENRQSEIILSLNATADLEELSPKELLDAVARRMQ